jgi:two-component system, chemotaxis family, sensor kinase CheA
MNSVDPDREALTRLFFEESEGGLLAMEQALVALNEAPDRTEFLQTLFRVAHTLKGNAGSLGFTDLARMTHGFEGVLARVGGGSLPVGRDRVAFLLESIGALRASLAEAKGH